MKLTYLTGYMSPHLMPLLNALGRRPGVELTVWYCHGDTRLRRWVHTTKPEHQFVVSRRRTVSWLHPEFHVDWSIASFLDTHAADLTLVSEYDIPTLRIAIAHLNRRRRPWVLRGERPALWKESLLRSLAGSVLRYTPLNTARAVVANGSLNALVYQELCPWGKEVYSVPYYLDANGYSVSREEGRRALAALTGTAPSDDDFVFAFTGSLIRRKEPLLLTRAFQRVAADHPAAKLCIIGDGPLRKEMFVQLRGGMQERVMFLGEVPYGHVAPLYRAADAFVFPTQFDGWGMVVNEAMASSLPVITTTTCGAGYDLVREGVNGFLVHPQDEDMLVQHMAYLVEHRAEAKRMGEAARKTVEAHSPEAGAALMNDVLVKILEHQK